jgi:hypothetical protein
VDGLISEWQNLLWKKDTYPRKEDPRCENHISDAALYVYRHVRGVIVKDDPIRPLAGSKEFSSYEEILMEQLEDEAEENKPAWWEIAR